MSIRTAIIVLMVLNLMLACCGAGAKTASHIVTAQMRQNALANVEKHEWAKTQQQRAVGAAAALVAMSDEELWRMLPSQWVPRNCGVHQKAACPNCGEEFFKIKEVSYNRWAYNSKEHPWKLQCKNCKTFFPANDYGTYYESGLDDRGEFDPEKADKSLLFNPEHPDPNDPDHLKWVDDGFGLKYGDDTLTFIAHYTYWRWTECIRAVSLLTNAYALTSDPVYAHKAGVLLARFADIYPNIDYSFVAKNGWGISDGGSHQGMIQGRIWETATASTLSEGYDTVYEYLVTDQELVDFCARMREQYPALPEIADPAGIARHIEDDLLTLFCEAVIAKNIAGNVGSTQRAMALAAIALDRPELTERYLDWLFEPTGGMIPTILVDLVSRDGPSFEAAPGYSRAPNSLVPVADLLRSYAAYDKQDIYRDYPKLKWVFLSTRAYRCLNEVTPMLGDSGKAQHYGDVTNPIDLLISGYRAYRTDDIAQEIWHSALYDEKRLEAFADIFDADPQALIDELVAKKPELPIRLQSVNSSGYGLAILQSEATENGRAAYISYGRTCGSHPHKDRLNISIFAKRFVMAPDLAYPEFTGGWPKRHAWTNHTMSHNTVTVNDRKQGCNWSGKTELFAGGDTARIAIIDGGPPVYEGVTTYRRALSLIDVSDTDSYAVDVFWVRGGTNHRMVNNGAGWEITTENLNVTKQPTGTFAGPDVPYAAKIVEPEEGCAAFSYLRDVSRGNATAKSSWIDWDVVYKDGAVPEGRDPHFRLHCLSPVDEIALAIGEPPHHRYQDDYFWYVIRSNLGEGIQSQFVSVLEPYEPTPFIVSTEPLEITGRQAEGFASAVRVTLTDGRTDTILIAENPGAMQAGGVATDAQYAFVRVENGAVTAAKLVRGTYLRLGDYELTAPAAQISGTVAGIDTSDWRDNLISVDPPVTASGIAPEALIGRHIIVRSGSRSDACYVITDIRDGGRVISVGDKTLIEQFADPQDYSKGYLYTVSAGEGFVIPLSVESGV